MSCAAKMSDCLYLFELQLVALVSIAHVLCGMAFAHCVVSYGQ